MTRRYVLNLGMGADSVAILLRYIYEPASHPCPLEDLIVISAQTGNEWPVTGRLMEAHILPLMRAHQIRYVQVARGGLLEAAGITVLSDTSAPEFMWLSGDYKLSHEMVQAGTVPQTAGGRKCSIKFKGWVIDTWLARDLGGEPFTQIMGFEANEPGRAIKDARDGNTAQRTGSYPLIDWGWDRETCERYIKDKTGVDWPKSACTMCPFALQNKAGLARVLQAYLDEPQAGVSALVMEHLSMSLNPKQMLAKDRSLVSLLRATGQHGEVLTAFSAALGSMTWRIYRVRRVIRPRAGDPSRPANASRSIEAVAEGSERQMAGELAQMAADRSWQLWGPDGILRAWVREREEGSYPAAEEFYVAAPAGAADKTGPGFESAWAAA